MIKIFSVDEARDTILLYGLEKSPFLQLSSKALSQVASPCLNSVSRGARTCRLRYIEALAFTGEVNIAWDEYQRMQNEPAFQGKLPIERLEKLFVEAKAAFLRKSS